MRRALLLCYSCAFIFISIASKAQMCAATGGFTSASTYNFTGTSNSWGWEGLDFSHDPALNRLQSSTGNGTKALFSKTLVAPASTISWAFSIDFNNGTGSVPGYIVFGRYVDDFGNFQELVLCFGAKIEAGNHSFNAPVPAALAGKNFQFHISFNFTGNASALMAIDNFTTDAVESFFTLPVKFGMFTARHVNEVVHLNWSADAEENTSHYVVERSKDGIQFSALSSIQPNANRIYQHIDKSPVVEGFYRIKFVDHDGRTGYSAIIRVKGSNSSLITRSYFSDANNITIQHDAAQAGSKLEIFSSNGSLLKFTNVVPGSQQTIVNLPSASNGIFFVRYWSGGRMELIKLVKAF